MAEAVFSMADAMRNVTLTVRITGQRRYAVRQWIAVRLMALAAVVLGCGFAADVELEP